MTCPKCKKKLPAASIQALKILDFTTCPKCCQRIKIEKEKIVIYTEKQNIK